MSTRMIRVFSIYGKVDGNTGIMTISQGIDNEFVMDCHKILQPKQHLKTGENVPNKWKLPVSKLVVCR